MKRSAFLLLLVGLAVAAVASSAGAGADVDGQEVPRNVPALEVPSNVSDVYRAAETGRGFGDLCNPSFPFVPLINPFASPPTPILSDKLCATAGFNNDPRSCLLLGLLEGGLVSLTGEASGNTCFAARQSPAASTSLGGRPLPYPFDDARPLPPTLPAGVMTNEGASFYWLWRNLYNFELWAGCAATNTPRRMTPGTPGGWLVPPGWRPYTTVWLRDGNPAVPNSGAYWPFATIITRGDSVVIFIRGTLTQQDWLADFDYNQVPGFTSRLHLPGSVHAGYNAVASELWPGICDALHSLIRDRHRTINRVYVAGHSLGAAVATLISYATQIELADCDRADIVVDALLVAPPSVGDDMFAGAYSRTVNARALSYKYDVVPQVPCTPTMVGCPNTLVPTATDKNGGLWPYAPVPGALPLLPAGMPQQALQWSLFGLIFPCQIERFARATHICSYNCYLSQFVADTNSLCKLWDVAGPGTFCPQFPTTQPYYPYVA